MTNYTEQETTEKIKELRNRINIVTNGFFGEIGEFRWFLTQGIAKQLHSMTTPEYVYKKSNLEEFENIVININVLNNIFDLLNEIESLNSDYEKQNQLKS